MLSPDTNRLLSADEKNNAAKSVLPTLAACVYMVGATAYVLLTNSDSETRERDRLAKAEQLFERDNEEILRILKERVLGAKEQLLSLQDFPEDLTAEDFEPAIVTEYVIQYLHRHYKGAYFAQDASVIHISDVTDTVRDPAKANNVLGNIQARHAYRIMQQRRIDEMPVRNELIHAARGHKKGYKLLPLPPAGRGPYL